MNTFSENLISHIHEEKLKHKPPSMESVLKRLYHACVASEQLLEDAAAACELYDDDDTKELGDYYARHYFEERGELATLVSDLSELKIDVNTLPPDPIIMAMIGTQYYLIKHKHPVCLLGYMAIMEADPTPIEIVEKLEKEYGEAGFKFLRMHAIRDLEHRKELIELIDSQPDDKKGLILYSTNNALMYLRTYNG